MDSPASATNPDRGGRVSTEAQHLAMSFLLEGHLLAPDSNEAGTATYRFHGQKVFGDACLHILTGMTTAEDYGLRVSVQFDGGPSFEAFLMAQASPDRPERSAVLRFRDGSEYVASGDSGVRPPPVDQGVALLEPITTEEYRAVEAILTELWRWIEVGNLSAGQQQQIKAMADLIRQQQLDTEAGATERWKAIGPARTALRVLAKDVPAVVGGWTKVIDLLYKVRWSRLAENVTDWLS